MGWVVLRILKSVYDVFKLIIQTNFFFKKNFYRTNFISEIIRTLVTLPYYVGFYIIKGHFYLIFHLCKYLLILSKLLVKKIIVPLIIINVIYVILKMLLGFLLFGETNDSFYIILKETTASITDLFSKEEKLSFLSGSFF